MTTRSVLLGLLGAAIICGVTFINDAVMQQSYLIGNHMPASVYGGLILYLVIIGPLLFYFSRRLALTSKELVVIITITLAACCVPGEGLMRNLTPAVMATHEHNRHDITMRKENVLALAPERMLADISQDKGEALDGFINPVGMREHMPISKIPWHAWKRPLLFWLPLVLTLWIALIGLSLVVHQQWSNHEHLAYPIATFANSLMPEEGKPRSSIFSNRLFWLGAGVILAIYLNNCACFWFPDYFIKIPTGVDLRPLGDLWETFSAVGGRTILKRDFYFTCVGIAYLLAADVSFSLGISAILWMVVYTVLITYGLSLGSPIEGATGYFLDLRLKNFLLAGAYIGMFMTILYIGRHYYYKVFRQALFIRPQKPDPAGPPEQHAIWGARTFLIFIAIFTLQIWLVGLDWPLALMYTALTVVLFLVMSRILAETGLFWIEPWVAPCAIIWGIFGMRALGPQMMLIMFLLTAVLIISPREALMPYIVNAFKLLDLQKIKPGKPAMFCVVAILIGITIALPITLYFQYDQAYVGARYPGDSWALSNAVWVKQNLEAQGTLEESSQISGWGRFAAMIPNRGCMILLAIGLFLVLSFSAIRLRWPKWPIHPVLFVFWGTFPSHIYFASFLLGWAIKVGVSKYGGIKLYQKLKPLMIGLIAGEIAAALLCSLISIGYHLITGETPPVAPDGSKYFHIFP